MTTETLQETPPADQRLMEAGRQFQAMMEALAVTGHTLTDLILASDTVGYETAGGRYTDMRDLQPVERTKQVRMSRIYRRRNPLVDRAVGLWTEMCFSAPWSYQANDEAFQDVIEGVRGDPKNRRTYSWSSQRRLSNALLVDGEVAFLYFVGSGRVRVRAIDPLEFLDPITNPEDRDEVWYWPRQWVGSDGKRHLWLYRDWDFVDDGGRPRNDAIPQAALQRLEALGSGGDIDLKPREGEWATLLAINTEGQRGYPLMASGLDWVRAHQEFLRDRAALTAERAKYATKVSVDGPASKVQAVASSLARPDVGSPEDGLRPPRAGTWVANRGMDMDLVQAVNDGQSARQDERALRMMATMPSGIPPHLFGDVGEGNLATASATEGPLRDMLTSYQGVWSEHLQDEFDHFARWLGYGGETAVDIDSPEILGRSLIDLAQVLASVAGVFPAVRRSEELLAMVLTEMGINNVDDVVAVLAPFMEPEDPAAADAVDQALEALREARERRES